MVESLIISLTLTLIIELFVAFLLGIRLKDDIFVIICANICTNPIVVYISNCVGLLNNAFIYWIVVAILEILAVIVEFIIYKNHLVFNKISPFAISFICNLISFGTGLIIFFI